MRFLCFATSLLVAAVTTGCATENVRKTELTQAAVQDEFHLDSILQYKKIGGVLQADAEHGLIPGIYKAEKSSAVGTFFLCEGRCVWARMVGHKQTFLYKGGVFVPHDAALPPAIFRVLSASQETTGDLNEYITQRTTSSVAQGGAVAPNVLGGVVAGSIIDAAVKAEEGTYTLLPATQDQEFVASLRAAIGKRSSASRNQRG